MFINRGMGKEDVVHIYSGVLLSHKKKEIAICNNIDEGKWNKSDREGQTLYSITSSANSDSFTSSLSIFLFPRIFKV